MHILCRILHNLLFPRFKNSKFLFLLNDFVFRYKGGFSYAKKRDIVNRSLKR